MDFNASKWRRKAITLRRAHTHACHIFILWTFRFVNLILDTTNGFYWLKKLKGKMWRRSRRSCSNIAQMHNDINDASQTTVQASSAQRQPAIWYDRQFQRSIFIIVHIRIVLRLNGNGNPFDSVDCRRKAIVNVAANRLSQHAHAYNGLILHLWSKYNPSRLQLNKFRFPDRFWALVVHAIRHLEHEPLTRPLHTSSAVWRNIFEGSFRWRMYRSSWSVRRRWKQCLAVFFFFKWARSVPGRRCE